MGNKFFVIVVEVDMYVKVWSFYKIVVSDLECVWEDYNIIVYRFCDKLGKIYEDY